VNKLYYFFASVVSVNTVLILDQIWFEAVPEETSWKLIATLTGLAAAVFIISALHREFIRDKKLRDNNYLD
jgi:hypothetical protein